MNKKLLITILLFLALLAGGCGLLDSFYFSDYGYGDHYGNANASLYDIAPIEDAEWTVLFYLCGTDLESELGAATANLLELLDSGPNNRYNLLVQTGGTWRWQNDAVDAGYLQRWMLANQQLLPVGQRSLANMAAAKTLGDFLSWGVENFPADKYALILWDHGGGSVNGLVYDELYGYDSLKLGELAEALSMSGVDWELVGFDACLMSTLETAAAIAPYANYMVASEEYEPAQGWDYAVWPAYLDDHSGWSGRELGRVICNSYYDKCRRYGNEAMATLAVTDLSRIPALCASFNAMAQEMSGVTGDINLLRQFTQGAARTENYGGNNASEGYTNMVDLGDLAINTESVLSQTADQVLDDLFAAVCYQVHGKSRSMANGLSVFYPLNLGAGELYRYGEVATSGHYLRFISAISGQPAPAWAGEELPPAEPPAAVTEDDYQVELQTLINEQGFFELHITNGRESVASVGFRLYYVDHDYEEYVLMGYDNDIDFSRAAEGIYYDNFRAVWPTVNGYYCAPQLLAEEQEYNLYSIPILLNDEEMTLRAAWEWDEQGGGHYEIYGVRSGVDENTGISSRDIMPLQDGDRVQLLFEAEDWDSGALSTYTMGDFTVSGATEMEESDLFDGEYMYQFVVTDVFGREYCSDEVIMEVEGEDIYLYETY